MTINELQTRLLEAYSVGNLNKISLTLINLFKTQQYSVLQKIADIISDFVSINITDAGKGFSKFMMLYHPDRSGFHINEISHLAEMNDFERLLEYSHILKLERIEEIAALIDSYEDIDYAPVYEWDMETAGFSVIDDSEINNEFQPVEVVSLKTNTDLVGYSFYDAIKIREYGDTDIEYPSFYLEDIEEFELSSSAIDDLDGIQFCINAKSIDLSDNKISDLSFLRGLINLEELDLSGNQIGFIDDLSNLGNLRSVNLSDNLIEDAEPLLALKRLEYAVLSGNNIDIKQINILEESGITVTFEY